MDIRKNIGIQIKEARMRNGLTQSDLGEKIGVQKQYMSGLENGRKTCSIEKLEQICEALGCELSVQIKC